MPYSPAMLDILKAWLPSLTVVIRAIWTLYSYLDHRREIDRAVALQAAHEGITRRIETQKSFLEKQLALYFETAQVTGNLATLKLGDKDASKAASGE
jgi:hypothetical protein